LTTGPARTIKPLRGPSCKKEKGLAAKTIG